MADKEDRKSKEQPIIIKKITKGGHAHHGGAWKVAYADFVTAMMAFFIVMWIVASSEEVKMQVTAYFDNPGAFSFITGKMTTPIDMGLKNVPGKRGGELKGDGQGKSERPIQDDYDQEKYMKDVKQAIREQAEADSSRAAKKVERAAQIIENYISTNIDKSPEMKDLLENLIVSITDEGLKIDLVEEEDDLFFRVGSNELKPGAKEILSLLAYEIGKLPNYLEIEGHTDSRAYGGASYTNWELSADRANAARRTMSRYGLWDGQISRVTGYADSSPIIKDNPFDNANRRISLIIKFKAASDFMISEDEVNDELEGVFK
jgi:chemotaxis protein MotB